MTNFLTDKSFLLKVNRHKVRRYYAAIMVLDFETENPLARLEGKVISGNLQVATNSPVRKTGSLTLVFDELTKSIAEINNLIAIDKKISLSIGIDNPFYHTAEYKKYGEILWFKQGVFVLTQASSSASISGSTVSINFQDKMAFLNGTCGGTLPANTSFHDKIIYDKDGNYTTEYPLIREIIFEAVHHFGGEHPSRIIIDDVPEVGRTVVRWTGSTPINFPEDKESKNSGRPFVIKSPPVKGFSKTYFKDDLIGYMETPLTYPGELVLKMGQFVTNVLDEIVKTLGNYEYFYDEEGVFHFQQIRNFQATGATPLNYQHTGFKEMTDSQGNVSGQKIDLDSALQALYFPKFTDDAFINEFADNELVTQIGFTPDFANIKNDFICWGTKNNDREKKAVQVGVRYHLAIDERPKDIPKPTTKEEEELIGENYSLCHKTISQIVDINDGTLIRYAVANTVIPDVKNERWGEVVAPALEEAFPNLDSSYHFNWREELYRRALLAYGSSTEGSRYDQELLAEWRNIFNPLSTFDREGTKAFQKNWEDHYGENNDEAPWSGYTVDVKIAPEKLRFWLDIVDTNSAIGKYSIKRIGCRSKITENSKINQVFESEIPDLVFVENTGDPEKMIKDTQYYIQIGQAYSFYNSDQKQYFAEINSFGTCYEEVRAMLYNHLLFNASVSLTTIPIFYLRPNGVVHLNFPEEALVGDYTIKSINWQLGANPSMTLALNEAITII